MIASLVQALSDKAGCVSRSEKARGGMERTANGLRSAKNRALKRFADLPGGVPAAMSAIQDFCAASSIPDLEMTLPLRFLIHMKDEGVREVCAKLKERWTALRLGDLKLRRRMSAPMFDDVLNTLFRERSPEDEWRRLTIRDIKLPLPMSSYKLGQWGKKVNTT